MAFPLPSMKIDISSYRVKTGQKVDLRIFPTKATLAKPDNHEKWTIRNLEKIDAFQTRLYAGNRKSLLIILQGMDASGKDSTIKHIMSGVNPQGVQVHSFKHPSELELSHDYLWRHYIKLPEQGMIGIFNRSHYENVLISKVHPQYVLAERIPGIEHLKNVNKPFWHQRYAQIKSFEETISETGTTILKFFLHLSKDEQKKRFLERIDKKEKHWKFSVADIRERQSWETYRKAYETAFEQTSTKENPWYIIPADDKWFSQFLITEVIIQTLKSMKLTFPVADEEQLQRLEEARKMLLSEKD